MSDERLRRLERRWLESGAPQDELAFLVGRVRAGELDRERVELAAYLGHTAAQLIPAPHSAATVAILVLGHHGDCPVVQDPPPADLPERAQAALSEYLDLGGNDWAVRHYVQHALDRSVDVGNPWVWPGSPPVSVCPLCRRVVNIQDWFGRLRRWGRRCTRRATLCVAACAARYRSPRAPVLDRRDRERLRAWVGDEEFAVERALDEISWMTDPDGDFARSVIRSGVPEVSLREILRDALVPWALRQADPVRDQVRAWVR